MGKNEIQNSTGKINSGKKFVMVIDLAKCKNARKCVASCQKAHQLPPNQELMKVYLMQESEEAIPYWMPKPCFHCEEPMCVEACPEGATFKREDGIVIINSEICKGCKLCLNACPYSSRLINKSKGIVPIQSDKPVEFAAPTEKESAVNKCDFCADLVEKGDVPHCVKACPMGVIYFGDQMEDQISNGLETLSFSETITERFGFRYMEDFGTKPNVYYLPSSSS